MSRLTSAATESVVAELEHRTLGLCTEEHLLVRRWQRFSVAVFARIGTCNLFGEVLLHTVVDSAPTRTQGERPRHLLAVRHRMLHGHAQTYRLEISSTMRRSMRNTSADVLKDAYVAFTASASLLVYLP